MPGQSRTQRWRAATAAAGQGLVEYGLILGLGALVTVIALVFFGGALAAALSLLGQAIDSSS
jgi:Flp pilus assembly pilin Flp